MLNYEKMNNSDENPVLNILLVRDEDKYWSNIKFPEKKEENDENKTTVKGCEHAGHDHSKQAQSSDSGLTITSENTTNNTLILHIHTDQPFQGLMVTTEAKGEFSVPSDMPMEVMENDCTGVTNSAESEKDHVMVDFHMEEVGSEGPVFKFLVVRNESQYWNNITYQA